MNYRKIIDNKYFYHYLFLFIIIAIIILGIVIRITSKNFSVSYEEYNNYDIVLYHQEYVQKKEIEFYEGLEDKTKFASDYLSLVEESSDVIVFATFTGELNKDSDYTLFKFIDEDNNSFWVRSYFTLSVTNNAFIKHLPYMKDQLYLLFLKKPIFPEFYETSYIEDNMYILTTGNDFSKIRISSEDTIYFQDDEMYPKKVSDLFNDFTYIDINSDYYNDNEFISSIKEFKSVVMNKYVN